MKTIRACLINLFFLGCVALAFLLTYSLTYLFPQLAHAAAAKRTWYYIEGFPCFSQSEAMVKCSPPKQLPTIDELHSLRGFLRSNKKSDIHALQIWQESNLTVNPATLQLKRSAITYDDLKHFSFWTNKIDTTVLGNPYIYDFNTGRAELDTTGSPQDLPFFCVSEQDESLEHPELADPPVHMPKPSEKLTPPPADSLTRRPTPPADDLTQRPTPPVTVVPHCHVQSDGGDDTKLTNEEL